MKRIENKVLFINSDTATEIQIELDKLTNEGWLFRAITDYFLLLYREIQVIENDCEV